MASADYKIVGKHYSYQRRPDERIARVIHTELSDVETIINIGAGTGSYEPANKIITAIEPSETMIAQRIPREKTTVCQASAESLPSDCTDGFLCAYWARPECYLDSRARSAISTFSRIQNIDEGIVALSNDLNIRGTVYDRKTYT